MDEFAQSTANLKQAVPLMIKYQIPTTPTNYALWYTYVAQTNPQLNQAIDRSISETGICSAVTSERLYQQHLAQDTERNSEQVKHSLEAIATELQVTMQDTRIDAEAFHQVLEKGFAKLSAIDNDGLSLDEMISLVRELVKNSQQIGQSTRFFRDQLTDAEKEIGELKDRIEQIRKEAYEDAMTGTLNRRAFDKEINTWIALDKSFCLVMLDIDFFKNINDNFGHMFGDQVLKAISRRLDESCKNGEHFYRIGGEEFALIVPNRKLMVARQFAESLRRAIERLSIMDKNTNQRLNSVTASFGVAEYTPGDNYQSLLHRADMQLYKAKQLGRNRVMPMSL
jgi:diguanylate cyclase (GGDEF) domain